MLGLETFYNFAKEVVVKAGYESEIEWQASKRFESVSETDFLGELAWVILASGMKESVVRVRFPGVESSFFGWDATEILKHGEACVWSALNSFGHEGKIYAILEGVEKVEREGFDHLKIRIEKDPIKVLQEFKFIGPITSFHLAKNLGVPVAKADRHLVRIASAFGCADVQRFCKFLSDKSGDKIQVVDIVLWRYATLDKDYIQRIELFKIPDTALLSESALAKDWLTPEEDEAWKDL